MRVQWFKAIKGVKAAILQPNMMFLKVQIKSNQMVWAMHH